MISTLAATRTDGCLQALGLSRAQGVTSPSKSSGRVEMTWTLSLDSDE